MKEGKVAITFNKLEEYRKKQQLEENLLSKLINKRKGEGSSQDNSRDLSEQPLFNELLYTIYQPSNMVIFKGLLSKDELVEQVLLSSENIDIALGSDGNALELKVLQANRPEDYGLYYLESGHIPEIIGTNLVLTEESLFVLLSLVDCKRYKRSLGFLMHQVEEKEITIEELKNVLEENIAFKDPRWLGGFFVRELNERNEYPLEKALQQLEQIGFLNVKKDVIEFTKEGEILLSLLERKQVILLYENFFLQSKEQIAKEKLFFIKTDNALFLIQEVEDKFSFTSIDMDIAKYVLETIFQVVDITDEPDAAIEDKKNEDISLENKENSEASIEDDSKKVVKTKGTVCPACGIKVHGNSKFCKECGAELKKLDTKQSKAKICNQCGNELASTAKFCKHCGNAVKKLDE